MGELESKHNLAEPDRPPLKNQEIIDTHESSYGITTEFVTANTTRGTAYIERDATPKDAQSIKADNFDAAIEISKELAREIQTTNKLPIKRDYHNFTGHFEPVGTMFEETVDGARKLGAEITDEERAVGIISAFFHDRFQNGVLSHLETDANDGGRAMLVKEDALKPGELASVWPAWTRFRGMSTKDFSPTPGNLDETKLAEMEALKIRPNEGYTAEWIKNLLRRFKKSDGKNLFTEYSINKVVDCVVGATLPGFAKKKISPEYKKKYAAAFEAAGIPQEILDGECIEISQVGVTNKSQISARIMSSVDLRGSFGTDRVSDFQELGDAEFRETNPGIVLAINAIKINNLRAAEVGYIAKRTIGWMKDQIGHALTQYIIENEINESSGDSPGLRNYLLTQNGVRSKKEGREPNFIRDMRNTTTRFKRMQADYGHLQDLATFKNFTDKTQAREEDIEQLMKLLTNVGFKFDDVRTSAAA